MAQTRRDRPGTSGDNDLRLLLILLVVIPLSFLPVLAFAAGGGEDAPWNPIALLLGVASGKKAWPASATVVLVVLILVLAAVVAGIVWAIRSSGRFQKVQEPRAEKRMDSLAATMTDPRDIPETDLRHLAEMTDRLAPAISLSHPGHGGIVMGQTVSGNREVRMPWEWVCVAIAGARMGKSATLAIPAALYAPGAMIATSNKKDIYTHTLYRRKQMGRVWLFDLQGVTTGSPRERASFWFNPLRPVKDLPSAHIVCDYFVSAATEEGARVDAYFDGNARDLFSSYLLAAALIGGDMRHVVDWLTNTQSQVPVQILEQRGYPELANTMRGKQQVNEKQRDGFYDMARRFLAPLDEPRFAEAVLPRRRIQIFLTTEGKLGTTDGQRLHDLPEFIAEEFVKSTDTVYAMSKEGPGSASALATALIGAVLNAAEDYGSTQHDGRMPLPLVAVLDEAANVCRLQNLPNMFSHYGSRAIILITILQSPSQGKAVWGETSFQAMLDAANMIWYGGNVSDEAYVNALSAAIGEHHVRTESRNRGAGMMGSANQASINSSWQREVIFPPSELKALPQRRAVLTLAGSKPILVRKVHWSATPFAEDVEKSLKECADDDLRRGQKALPVGHSSQPTMIVDEPLAEPALAVVAALPVAAVPTVSIERVLESEFFSPSDRSI